jgi:hypothetical protein
LLTDPITIALLVARALEACDVRYLVGGSVASSLTGEPRSTLDVDLVVAMSEADVEPFLSALGKEFYADADALRRAIRGRSSANLIHYGSSTKVDLFIAGGTPLDEEQLARRRRVRVRNEPEGHLYVYAPEDILLQKLRRYRLGNEVSDRHWRDVLGIVLVQGDALDEDYLRRGAAVLRVSDLLERALGEGRAG